MDVGVIQTWPMFELEPASGFVSLCVKNVRRKVAGLGFAS